ncbi:MAG TPA: Mur ligase family protein [Candidatus Saccharimonadia bacterium]|nr:Mur ligase family protein [Candidatus Saccharimonadia bacterium]
MKPLLRRIIASLFERQVRRVIARHHLTVVAVAGSVGKTTTKQAIATVLSEKYQVLVHPGNYNSELGLPLSVFELTVPASLLNPFAWIWRLVQAGRRVRNYPYQVLVLELATDHPGEIPRYLRYLTPDIGVLTALTPEHMENFPGGLDEVAAEEMALAGASKILVLNDDAVPQKYQDQYLGDHPSVLKYGHKIGGNHPSNPQILGDHMRLALDAAALVARQLKLTPHQIQAGIERVRPVSGRMNPLPGINGTVIIDDTYNSSPEAIVAALTALASYPASGRRIAILGSMNEMGSASPRYHEEAGVAAAGVDLLVTIGALANTYLGPAAVNAGLDPTRWKPADSPYVAGAFLGLLLQPGDVVLAKGSQNGVFAEEAVKLLLADPADAAHLVRQSPAWLRTKRAQFPDAQG